MFNLLVSFGGWGDHADTIPTGRIYIEADKEPGCRVMTDGKLDIAKVGALPALLMSETTGREPCIARVGRITEIHPGRPDTRLEYIIDTRISPISSHDFNEYATQLGTTERSLTHTHWAVCSGDLYRTLYFMQKESAEVSKPPAPSVFSTEGIHNQEADLVSVMMPFGAEFTPVYKALQKAAAANGLRCQRADEVWKHHQVSQDIVDLITKARVVICDCTSKNPNVFYEIGIAHSLGKDVLLITQSKADVPFDLQHLRYVSYLKNREGLGELTKAVQERIKTLI